MSSALGRISMEQFQMLTGGYTEEKEKPAAEIPEKETAIQKLTPELLRLFIQKIVVHEKSVKWSKHTEQTVEIHYSDIEYIGAQELSLREEKEPQHELPKQSLPGSQAVS